MGYKVTVEFENKDEYQQFYYRFRDFENACWKDNAWSSDLTVLDELKDKIYPN